MDLGFYFMLQVSQLMTVYLQKPSRNYAFTKKLIYTNFQTDRSKTMDFDFFMDLGFYFMLKVHQLMLVYLQKPSRKYSFTKKLICVNFQPDRSKTMNFDFFMDLGFYLHAKSPSNNDCIPLETIQMVFSHKKTHSL